LKNGKKYDWKKNFLLYPQYIKKIIEVEVISSHYVDPKGERVKS
jgi:hypothetical protein